jgi:hypothetical protein
MRGLRIPPPAAGLRAGQAGNPAAPVKADAVCNLHPPPRGSQRLRLGVLPVRAATGHQASRRRLGVSTLRAHLRSAIDALLADHAPVGPSAA